jgi:hypothetical protein
LKLQLAPSRSESKYAQANLMRVVPDASQCTPPKRSATLRG